MCSNSLRYSPLCGSYDSTNPTLSIVYPQRGQSGTAPHMRRQEIKTWMETAMQALVTPRLSQSALKPHDFCAFKVSNAPADLPVGHVLVADLHGSAGRLMQRP